MKTRSIIVLTILAVLLLTGVLLGLQLGAPTKSNNAADDAAQHQAIFLNQAVQFDKELYLTLNLFLTPIVAEPNARQPKRYIAAFVNWKVRMDLVAQTSMKRAFDPSSREAVMFTGTVSAECADPMPENPPPAGIYAFIIEPRPGLTWGTIKEDGDVVFDVQLIEEQSGTPR